MRLRIWTDGGSRGNPGPAGAGVVIRDAEGETLFSGGFFIVGEATNNVAEYEGILRGLKAAKDLGGTKLDIFCDSDLLVKQVNGQYRVKNAHLKIYHRQVMDLINQFEQVTVKHVYRDDNTAADTMVNKALDARADVGGKVKRDKNTPAAEKKTIENSGSVFLQSADLRKKADGCGGEPCREVISEGKSLVGELLCLQSGRHKQIEGSWAEAMITVLRGRGVIEAGREKQSLRAGTWLLLGPVERVEFSAHAGESL
ncbi:MAG: reverse transcriptase-like protein, partial [Sedimentisphaerales bacterium]|nr:reverse transcriptase-like protein [Sedimentisphaerales bacterium]